MTIRKHPIEPFNQSELDVIAERQEIVRQRIRTHFLSADRLFSCGAHGQDLLHREVMVARAAMAGGLNLLHRKHWRAIGWELRLHPHAWIARYRPSVQDDDSSVFTATVIPEDGGVWTQRAVRGIKMADPMPTFGEVLEWLGLAGGSHGYPGHSDSLYEPAGSLEQIGDFALIWDRTDVSGWDRVNNLTAWAAVSTWYPVMIGAGYRIGEGGTGLVTVAGRPLSGLDFSEWVLDALRLWTNPRDLFDAVQEDVLESLQDRRLPSINSDGSVNEQSLVILENIWDLWKGIGYDSALVEGARAT